MHSGDDDIFVVHYHSLRQTTRHAKVQCTVVHTHELTMNFFEVNISKGKRRRESEEKSNKWNYVYSVYAFFLAAILIVVIVSRSSSSRRISSRNVTTQYFAFRSLSILLNFYWKHGPFFCRFSLFLSLVPKWRFDHGNGNKIHVSCSSPFFL